MLELSITPLGHLAARTAPADGEAALPAGLVKHLQAAFEESTPRGLLHLGTAALQASLPAPFDFARQLARSYLTRLCQTSVDEATKALAAVPPPTSAELASLVLQAPPMQGLEYLSPDVIAGWWHDLDELVRSEIQQHPGGVQAYLTDKNPLWRVVGRITFHLAENKRDPECPFAFLATFASKLSERGKVQHEPLGSALQQFAGARNKAALLNLLVPLQRATERSVLAKELLDSGEVYQPLAWTPREAYRFLQDVPIFEESGLIVRVPDWWSASRPPRPLVSVKVDGKKQSTLGVDALLDFNVNVSIDGTPLSEAELQRLLASVDGLVQLKGKWVEVDRAKLAEALEHWRAVERQTQEEGLSFFEGMRLLSGAALDRDAAAEVPETTRAWTGLTLGPALEGTLNQLRSPESLEELVPTALRAELRPYQRVGLSWLRFLTRLGLGACLADDMGLGKTVQVIALLLDLRQEREKASQQQFDPCLLIVPASLIANWKSEIDRFAPSLRCCIAHPSELPPGVKELRPVDVEGRDLVITTYGMVARLAWLAERTWRLVILDEAQAIRNSGTLQARTVKKLKASGRIALTGTPVENRLSDLWSLFDFLNPGLLGNAKAFSSFVKRLDANSQKSYQPLRTLIQPYVLRRLKTDKRVIADLPDKTEMPAYCALSRQQAALYEQTVRDLERRLQEADGIQRRGLVLAQLMRLKQICNHPAQLLGNDDYDPKQSGKFQRVAELCEELAARQEKALIFTQFRELAEPLARFLQGIFGRSGLTLHGGTSVAKRRELVESFQRETGPPFFVLSLKAGGTGLNLTAASHVIHFDRWWNPAVENQATDRAFRIGQKKNVLVHKFVCRGTVEEKIDEMIAEKSNLASGVLEGGGEMLLTEMDNDQLLRFVALDVTKALD